MKTRFSTILLLICCFLPAEAAEEKIQGWKSAKWGMTEEEVREAFKADIYNLQKPDEWRHGIAKTGVDLQLCEKPWDARFVFDREKKRLIEVILQPKSSVDSPLLMFPDLERQLTEKYGQPDSKSDERIANNGINRLRSWKRGSTRIELRYSKLGLVDFQSLTIKYKLVPEGGNKDL